MRYGSGRAWRGLARACVRWGQAVVPGLVLALVGLSVAPATLAQVRHEGAIDDGRGGVVALASGDMHSCAIRSNGTVACWGANFMGQATPPAGRFIALSAGNTHTCGLRDDGQLLCWGDLSLPPPVESDGPEAERFVAIDAGGRGVCAIDRSGQAECQGSVPYWMEPYPRSIAIATGQTHACALAGDGTPRCWGDVQGAAPDFERFVQLVAGYSRTCGLRADGTVSCWGQPFWGTEPPVQQAFTAITLGGGHGCGLAGDGTVSCWGDGPGTEVPADLRGAIALSAGADHTCALRGDGAIRCWGADYEGQATPPEGVFGLGSIDGGYNHACQVRPDGQLDCWGRDDVGQSQPPTAMPWEGLSWVAVDASFDNSCARRSDGPLQCWGGNDYGQSSPAPVPLLRSPVLGWAHGCALATDGTAHCWGWNENGQATPPAERYRSLSAGFVHSCGVRDDGTAECWGYNDNQLQPPPPPYGEWGLHILGMQSNEWGLCALFSNRAVNCTGTYYGSGSTVLDDVRAYSQGLSHACWIRNDGRLACTAENGNWVQMPAGRFVSIASGGEFSCAIRSDGGRVCWDEHGFEHGRHYELEPRFIPPMGLDQPQHIALELNRYSSSETFHPVAATFAVVGGTLPEGISLVDGALVGAPTQAGTFVVQVEGRDEDGFVYVGPLEMRIDDTPPTVSPVVEGPLGENEWYVGDVLVNWAFEDPDSGAWGEQGCDGVTLSTDSPAAGFSCTARSVGGTATGTVTIKRDATAPETAIGSGPAAVTAQTTASFDFGGGDVLSGLARFECSLDSTPFAACTSSLTLDGLGAGMHVFAVRAVDQAGNVDGTPALHHWRVDTSAPVITPRVTGELGNNGWYVGDVSISWTVQDPDTLVQSMTGCESVTLRTDSPGASFTCTATSTGGSASQTVTVKRDATAPLLVAVAQTAPNAHGWYRNDVVVEFTCADAASGLAGKCPAATVVTGEGELEVASVSVVDAAGNRATSAPLALRIDRTAPTLAPSVPASVLLRAASSGSANAADALSGVLEQACGALATNTVGVRQTQCTATDRAGNTASVSASYRVVYGFNGFTTPVQNAPALNVLKAGRSVPLRWRVVDALGAPVTNLTSASVSAAAISCPTASENRISEYGGSSAALKNLGNGYYQLDWQSASSLRNLCRRLDLNLGDGVSRSAPFKFN